MSWYLSLDNAINAVSLSDAERDRIVTGLDAVCQTLGSTFVAGVDRVRRPYFVAVDGFSGVHFRAILEKLTAVLSRSAVEAQLYDVTDLFRAESVCTEIRKPYERPDDPSFGHVFGGRLVDFIDPDKMTQLISCWERLRKDTEVRKVVICFGAGAALSAWREWLDEVVYCDLTREHLLVRYEQGEVSTLGTSKSSEFAWKTLYYVEYPVLNRHKKEVLESIHWYIDDSEDGAPKLLPGDLYHNIIGELSMRPISFKVFYMPGVFGGTEFIDRFKVRNLPNTSWDYEISVGDNHLLVDLTGTCIINLPFYNVFWEQPLRVLGTYSSTVYPDHFPIAIYMQDGYFEPDDKADFKRTHMPLHLHPDTAYNRQHFGEPLGRYETYYIVRADEGACTMHGFKDEANIDEFISETKQSADTGKEFDWRRYIYEHPSKTGELHQLPPGTVHGTGGRQIILEIDTQPSRESTEYSFFLYDYCRPNFNYRTLDFTGRPMKLHLTHSLAIMRRNRKQEFMAAKCRPAPVCIREGSDWREMSFPMYYNMPYQINRFEFKTRIEDDTQDLFHCLALTSGSRVRVYSKTDPSKWVIMEDCDNMVVPACFGEYVCENLTDTPCEMIKTFLITEPRDHIDKEREEKDWGYE